MKFNIGDKVRLPNSPGSGVSVIVEARTVEEYKVQQKDRSCYWVSVNQLTQSVSYVGKTVSVTYIFGSRYFGKVESEEYSSELETYIFTSASGSWIQVLEDNASVFHGKLQNCRADSIKVLKEFK